MRLIRDFHRKVDIYINISNIVKQYFIVFADCEGIAILTFALNIIVAQANSNHI